MIVVATIMICMTSAMQAQAPIGNIAEFTYLKMKHVDGGSAVKRDSLLAIYNTNVTDKNEYILSHHEYRHYYTPNSTDYVMIDEYKDLASMEKANEMISQLEEKAWPDKMKREAFMDAMNAYFENWHGDGIFTTNPKLSKN